MSEISELPMLEQELPGSVSDAATKASENNPNVLTAIATEKAAAQTIVTTITSQKPDISLSLSGTESKTSESVSVSLSFDIVVCCIKIPKSIAFANGIAAVNANNPNLNVFITLSMCIKS